MPVDEKMQAMKPPTLKRHNAMRAVAVVVGGLCVVWGVQAQQSVYRCGQEYTNAPRDKSQCQLLQAQAVTVIEGTRPNMGGTGTVPAEGRTHIEPSKAETPTQKDRDVQARTIVATELEKTQQQHAQMMQEYKQGATVQWSSESREQAKHKERMAVLKAAIERAERDMESLQRELARRPTPSQP